MKKYQIFTEELNRVNAALKANGSKFIYSHESRSNHTAITLYKATEEEATNGRCTAFLTSVSISEAIMFLHGAYNTIKYFLTPENKKEIVHTSSKVYIEVVQGLVDRIVTTDKEISFYVGDDNEAHPFPPDVVSEVTFATLIVDDEA